MVKVRSKVVFDGMAKIRIVAIEGGKPQISAEVDGPDASNLKSAFSSLIEELCNADSDDLARLAEEMRQT
jgi:hypothetical protein